MNATRSSPSLPTAIRRRSNRTREGVGQGFAGICTTLSRSLAVRATRWHSPSRTRIAHIDTGYDKTHNARPENILTDLDITR